MIGTRLTSELEHGLSTLLLIDPLLGDPIPVQPPGVMGDPHAWISARQEAWSRPVHTVELTPKVPLAIHQWPYVVELNGPDDPVLFETIEIAQDERVEQLGEGLASSGRAPVRIGGWLQTGVSASDAVPILADLMHIRTDAITSARYQRVADRRVLAWLRHVVGTERVVQAFGPIQSWHYLDACGGLACLRSSSHVSRPLRLNRQEWALFMQGEMVHQACARWLGELKTSSFSEDSFTNAQLCYERTTEALRRSELAAKRWPTRFASAADVVAWAALTLCHPQLDSDKEIAALLDASVGTDEILETIDGMSGLLNAMHSRTTS